MPTRRRILVGALAAACCHGRVVRAESVLGDDGLYREPWFLESFLDLPDDLRAANEAGRRLAILWELRGCPLCRRLHQVNFADPAVGDFIRARFDILQLNIVGAREVTDFDGERLTEKRFAQKYGVRSTPTVQFLAESAAAMQTEPLSGREVLRITGYVAPGEFRRTFAFVAERGYAHRDLDGYLARAEGGE